MTAGVKRFRCHGRAVSTADDRADSNMVDDGLSNATLDMAEVGSVAKTLLDNDLNGALREQTLALGQLRGARSPRSSPQPSRVSRRTKRLRLC